MAEAGTLHDAFIDELRDTYDAEKQLTKALAKLAKASSNTATASPGSSKKANPSWKRISMRPRWTPV